MITASKNDFEEIIKDAEDFINDRLQMERSIVARIENYRERMEKFGARDYYEKQISSEEELLFQVRTSLERSKSFLEELKKSYNKQYL